MDIVATLLFLAAAAGLVRLAFLYLTGPVPAEYHRRLIEASGGAALDAGQRAVLTAIYRVLGSALLSVAAMLTVLALLAHGQGASLPLAGLAVGLALIGVPGVVVPRGMERRTGARTPWRAAAGLVGVAALGLVLSFV